MREAITILSTKTLKPEIHQLALKQDLTLIETDFISSSYTINDDIADRLRKSGSHLIFTSQHAVRSVVANKERVDISFAGKKIFCLQGETLTATALLEGIEVIGTAPKARDLATLIIAQNEIKGLSFICGDKRLDILPAILKENNISVEEIIVYETKITGGIVKNSYQGIFFFSPSGVESFFQTNILAKNITCFCIGDTTAKAVMEHTGNTIVKAGDMTQESMLLAAQQYFHKKKYKTS